MDSKVWIMVRRERLKMLAKEEVALKNVQRDIHEAERGGALGPVAALGAAPTAPAAQGSASGSAQGIEVRARKDIEADIQVPEEGDVECTKCHITFKTTGMLIKHITARHEGVKKFACNTIGCNKSFITKEGLDGHILFAHTADKGATKRYKCQFVRPEGSTEAPCTKTFGTKRAAVLHLETHKPSENAKCPHNGCDKVFSRFRNMVAHQKTCSKNPNPNYIQCSMCAAEPFKEVRLWTKHCREVHNF